MILAPNIVSPLILTVLAHSFTSLCCAGKPASLLTAWDSMNYRVQVSIPPPGKTRLKIQLEELLRRRLHQVEFQVPLSPGVHVERLEIDVTVSEPESGTTSLVLDNPGYSSFNVNLSADAASAHFEAADVSGGSLQRLVRGSYATGNLPESGLLMTDGNGCVTLLFNPTTFLDSGPMPRNIVFVIDLSGSMSGEKLIDAKVAFTSIIQTLSSDDFFAIHIFSDKGTEALWEPTKATSEVKAGAISFVNSHETIGGTNLHDAYIDGLERVEAMQSGQEGTEYVPILVVLTDGQASTGITLSQDISRAVRTRNQEANAKIFALAFGFDADLSLLRGISIQNGGIAVSIYEGYGDAADQMNNFYQSELGSILMTDINVGFGGDFKIESSSLQSIPIFPDGAEVVTRSLIVGGDISKGILQATTTARTAAGKRSWFTELDMEDVIPNPNSECAQGWAHAQIADLMNYRTGVLSLGSDMSGYGNFEEGACAPGSSGICLADLAKQRAIAIALDGGLVWPGLTALVTVEGLSCDGLHDGNSFCTDGDILGSNDSGNNSPEESDSSWGGNKQRSGDVTSTSMKSSGPNTRSGPSCVCYVLLAFFFFSNQI